MPKAELSIEINPGWTPNQAGMLEFVAKGASISAAAAALGIHRTTVYVWKQTIPGFADALRQAEGIAEVNYTLSINNAAAHGDWYAAKFWLSRRRRETYGDNIDLDIDTRINKLLAELEQGGEAKAAEGADAEGSAEIGGEADTSNPERSEDSNP